MDVQKGEIVGIAGIDGNGQSELIQAIIFVRLSQVALNCINQLWECIRQITELSGTIPEDRHRDAGLIWDDDFSHRSSKPTTKNHLAHGI